MPLLALIGRSASYVHRSLSIMCGIAGYVGHQDSRAARSIVQRMTDAMARRGPDAEGHHAWDGVAFGHRRLSIFDLSAAGKQPMLLPDGDVGIVFNGSIYNFPELRAELEQRGCRFISQTDTEVLLHGYREWGLDELLKRLRGMFSIGLWDKRSRRLYLIRDRLGVKPLYYSLRGREIAFASTADAFRRAGLVDELDPVSVAQFLEYGYVTDDRSIYCGLQTLPPASILEWHDGKTRVRTYWDSTPTTTFKGTFSDAVDETRRLFLNAVKRRLFADVPIGTLLSGGIDSSLVCWAVRELGGDVTAFTVGTPGDPSDESEDARQTARELGIRHTVLDLANDEFPDARELAVAYGEPFASASGLGMLRVSKAVKSAATVLLTGDGGDDVFLGYPRHRHMWYAQQLAQRLPDFAAPAWRGVRNLVPQYGPLRRAGHLLDYATGGLGAAAHPSNGFAWFERNGLLGERLAGVRLPHREIPWSIASGRHLLTDFLDFEHRHQFVGEYMTKVDGATMYYALEARSPFLDQDLWEFASSLPYDLRLQGGVLKAVLRELARREIGPRVAHGRKRGFGIPAERWLAGPWRSGAEEVFRGSILAKEGWIIGDRLWKTWQRSGFTDVVSTQLWYVYALELWRHTHMASIG